MDKEDFFTIPVYASRLIYGINWFAITPAFILIESQLHLSELEIGFIATSFFAGLMPFQFIGGILASRVSPRYIAITGLFIIGFTNGILEGFNSLIQSAKAKARGYRTHKNFINMAYLILGKLDLRLPT